MLQRSTLIALVLASATPALAQTTDWSLAKRVEIGLSNYAFTPKELHLQHGVPYVLHFTNSASKSHDFAAPKFFAATTIAPDDQAKVVKGSVELDENQTTDVKLIANTPGTYDVTCTHFMHEMLGMSGKVVVE
jgi:plastocyanin